MATAESASKIPAIMSWSGGKDSAYALRKILQDGKYEVQYLLSTFNGVHQRLSMHGVREQLIAAQALATGIPLVKMVVYEAVNDEYERELEKILPGLKAAGIEHVIFGDIFLEDLRAWRERLLERLGMKAVFPLWQVNTRQLLDDFIADGFMTITCCVNDRYLDESWCGRLINKAFIDELPAAVDSCGENGEYHSFCFAGPVFTSPVAFTTGATRHRPIITGTTDGPVAGGFWYCDLLPGVEQ